MWRWHFKKQNKSTRIVALMLNINYLLCQSKQFKHFSFILIFVYGQAFKVHSCMYGCKRSKNAKTWLSIYLKKYSLESLMLFVSNKTWTTTTTNTSSLQKWRVDVALITLTVLKVSCNENVFNMCSKMRSDHQSLLLFFSFIIFSFLFYYLFRLKKNWSTTSILMYSYLFVP